MFYNFLLQARKMGASDLHLSINHHPKVRVDGEIINLNGASVRGYTERDKDDLLVAEAMLYYGKKLDKMDLQGLVEQSLSKKMLWNLQKQGEIDFAWEDDKQGRCRVNIYKDSGSYAMAVRLINKRIPSCQQLGIPQAVQKLMERKNGLILITGPTGSGKTTTLASLIQLINQTKSAHIITLEQPIEYTYPDGLSIINQREIGVDSLSFASGLRSALREDPDIILVGELRDEESLKVALQAAETGHLVLSTMHTKDTVGTINRILDMLPNQREQVRSQLADNLIGIVSQDLVKNSNSKGRSAVMEVLINNNAIANLIREGRTQQIYSYLQTGQKQGMQTMAFSMDELRKKGII